MLTPCFRNFKCLSKPGCRLISIKRDLPTLLLYVDLFEINVMGRAHVRVKACQFSPRHTAMLMENESSAQPHLIFFPIPSRFM